MPESSETDLPGPPTIEGDGTVVAEIHPDADTTIQFVVDEPDDEDASVDLVIVGRDGGIDYGRIVEEGNTPLELFLAIEGSEADVPFVLERAHRREAVHTRDGDEAVRLPPIPSPIPPNDGWETTVDHSTFSCKSFSKFKTMLSNQFVGAPNRNEVSGSQGANANPHVIQSPPGNLVWSPGQAHTVICNFDSVGNLSTDRFTARACHLNALQPGAGDVCVASILSDNMYLKRVYGHAFNRRVYWAEATNKPSALTSFIGIVRRD
ncbi:MAG: hypothetical protein KC731_05355 [Myxococcales bacterium]|nr:hypothetical protein [Myxococcales bacterium]